MDIAVFVTIWSITMSPADLHGRLLGEPLDFLKNVGDVKSVEVYLPESGNVPVMDDVPAPAMIVQIDLDSPAAAAALVGSGEFERLFTNAESYPAPVGKINIETLEAVHYDLPGHESPLPRTAPLSFVVRYYGPVADAADFIDFYTNNHPPLLAKFPGIRNVLCYLPLNWRSMQEITDDYMFLGNEVVFDDLDALNQALASDVLPEVLADGEQFAAYGYNTHHAMQRRQVYARGDR